MKNAKIKRRGFGLEIQTFDGNKRTYLVFRTSGGNFHTFVEVEAKEAALDCGIVKRSTNQMWRELWKQRKQGKI